MKDEIELNWDSTGPLWRAAIWFCLACSVAIIAMIVGIFATHLITVTAGNAAQIGGAPW